jgi:predicted RNase H-like HicB family nuclease
MKPPIAVHLDREADGRWIADVPELPGVTVYGSSEEEAMANAKAMALHVIADRIEHGEPVPDGVDSLFSATAA